MASPVEARGLVHRYGDVTALDGLSLGVGRGELFGLVGPDGAGKTTAIRVLAGLVKPDHGDVRVFGVDPLDHRSGVRERLGYMPQRYSLYGDLSVEENLDFFGRLFCLDAATYRARAERLLQLTRLAPFRDRRADALSGGMYKKLALAAALLHEPEVLLLDEPTNGVDPISRAELWDLLYEFVAHGMTVLVSTPYMDEAERCHRVALLHRGKVVIEGAPADLVAGFEDAVLRVDPGGPAVEEALAGLGDALVAVTPAGGGLRAVVRGRAASDAERALSVTGCEVRRIRASFEDLFLSRVGGGMWGR